MRARSRVPVSFAVEIDLKETCAIVTGGSRGIGRAVALALARRGAAVVALYLNDTVPVRQLGEELARLGGGYAVRADVTKESAVRESVRAAAERFGKVDVLVNNAGAVSHRMLSDLELEEWRRVLDTNLTSMYLASRAVCDVMPAGGSIINVGSGVAAVGMPARAHYGASKAGVTGLTRALCKELGPRGIRVNQINPGIIETDQTAGLTPEARRRYETLPALGRLGRAEEVADVVVFLASDLSRYVSGAVIAVNGGI